MTSVDEPSRSGAPSSPEGPTGQVATTRRVARNTIALIAADVSSKLGLFVLYAVIARTLGTGVFGDYTLAASLAFFVRVAGLGTDLILTREVSRSLDNAHGLTWDTIRLKLAIGLPVLAAVVGFAALDGNGHVVVISTALLGISNLIDILALSLHSILRGREQMGPSSRALVLENAVLVVMGSVALLALDGGLIALGVIYVIAPLIGVAYLWGSIERLEMRPRRRERAQGLGWLFRAAASTGLATLLGIVLARIDAVILSVLTDSSRTVGLYGGAYRIFDATLFVSWAFGLAVYPILSRQHSGSGSLRRVFEVSMMAIAAVTVPLGMAMALYGPTIIEAAFGASFEDGGSATRILGVAAATYGVFSVASLTLAGQDLQRLFPVIGGAALALNLALNFLLIPSLSLDGAAIAMSAAQGLATLLAMFYVLRKIGPYSLGRIFFGVTAGTIAMTVPALLLGIGGGSLLLSLAAFGAAFLAVETALHREDLALLVRALTRRGQPAAPAAPEPTV